MARRAKPTNGKRADLEAQRWRLEAEDLARRGFSVLDRSQFAKSVAGDVAGAVGAPLGAIRGVAHDAQAVADGGVFLSELATSQAARDAAVHAAKHMAQQGAAYASSRAARPELIKGDLARAGDEWNRKLNPAATPVAGTFTDEVARRFGIGLNQGEATYNAGTLLLPVAGEVKGAVELGRFAKAGPLKYIKMGETPERAAYLAEREFETLGHHSFAPRRAKTVAQVPAVQIAARMVGLPQLPEKLLGDVPVPAFFRDSVFNVVKPRGVERGQFYRLHYGLDDSYHGGRVSNDYGGGGWSGRKLGWRRYGPAERLWHGTPGATKAAGLGSLAVFDSLGRVAPDDEQSR